MGVRAQVRAVEGNFLQAPAGTRWCAIAIQTHWGEHPVLSKDWKEKGERRAAMLFHRDVQEHSKSLGGFLMGETKNP